jgi:glutamate---cysteine ligase / carboxylate-amine ligase
MVPVRDGHAGPVADPLREPRFGAEEPFGLGVEEELFLVDARDGTQIDAREHVLDRVGDVPRGQVTGEVHACEVEIVTGVCSTAGQAIDELGSLRRAVLETGVGIMGTGTHPTAEEGASEISDRERYRFIAEQLGDALATPVGALHVHVGMPDAETAIRAFNGLRRHLPLLEALAANAPYRHGRDSCFASARELALRMWARSGTPRAMADYADFAAYADRLTRAAGVPDYTFHWWKLRPHPRLGTVELRALDAQSSLAHTGVLVALVHALARHEATADPVPGPAPEILEEASYRARRSGVAASLPDPDGTLRPVADVLEEALALARPAAEELGSARELAGIGELVAAGGGAGLQRSDHDRGGMPGVLAGLLERTGGTNVHLMTS